MRSYESVSLCAFFSILCVGCGAGMTGNSVSAPKSQKPHATVTETTDVETRLSNVEKAWICETTRISTRDTLNYLQFIDASHGWSVSDKGILYRTVDGGSRWERIEVGTPADAYVTHMFFVNPSTGWLLTSAEAPSVSEYQANEARILQTTDGGVTWKEQYKAQASGLSRVAFANQQEGWSVGVKFMGVRPLHQANTVLYTSDQGRTWADVSASLNQVAADGTGRVQDWATDVLTDEPHKATVLTLRGKVFSTTDAGKNWIELGAIQNEPRQTCICRLGVSKMGEIMVAGGTDSQEGTWGIIARLSQKSWQRIRLSGFYLKDAILISDQEILACGSNASNRANAPSLAKAGAILYSKDAGRNWSIIYQTAKIKTVNALWMINKDNVWAAGDAGFLIHLQRSAVGASPTRP